MVDLNIEIPEGFLNEEVRCGYTVTKEMKEVWAVEIDLLNEFIRLCKEYDLKYYCMGGTLLGTVRHKGFIPWDDDIDILMPRDSYDKFMKIGKVKFESPYFLSYPDTEYKFWRSHLQLRNSNTTGCIEDDVLRNNNKGIFIDIFPLDVVPNNKLSRRFHRIQMNRRVKLLYWDMDLESSKNKFKKSIKKIATLFIRQTSYKKAFNKFNRVEAKYNNEEKYNTVAHTSLSYREAVVWNKDDFLESQEVPFEFIKVNIPKGYDSILTKHYGEDYMTIPDKIVSTSHGKVHFDTSNSYLKYYK